jgi:hypothetical protein
MYGLGKKQINKNTATVKFLRFYLKITSFANDEIVDHISAYFWLSRFGHEFPK